MSQVYVVQNQHRWDANQRQFVPKFDLTAAEEYGKLEFLLSPTAAPFRAGPLIAELQEKLSKIEPEDYVLLIGNPVLIGIAVAIAAGYNQGNLNVLQWSGKDGRYLVVRLEKIFTF